jgi:hypothetical protein
MRMSDRSANRAEISKLRLPELLKARLEADARRAGSSINAEIVRRLEGSVRDEDLGSVVFGSAERFGRAEAIDRLILALQMTTGKDMADRETRHLIADTVASFLKHGPEIVAAMLGGEASSPVVARTVADAYALTAIAEVISQDLDRRASAAAEKAAAEQESAAG